MNKINFLMIDDEHELYRVMMADIFLQKDYFVTEIPRMKLPNALKKLYNLHYSYRFNIPFKGIWNKYYFLHKYPFNNNEKYVVLFMNGSFRKHFDKKYLLNIKRKHPNVKLALLLFDHSSYFSAKRCLSFRDIFDYAFSFDDEDCKTYKMEKFYTCFSVPNNIKLDEEKHSSAFFIGSGIGRLQLLQNIFYKITSQINGCKFYITEVPEEEKKDITGLTYNHTMPFAEEMQMSYNTDCIIEVVKSFQKGISLRTCEAIVFNKKLITNNCEIKKLPFYDPKYMSVFTDENDIDLGFIKNNIDVSYNYNGEFSPLRILKRITELENYNQYN